ncbi:MAG: FUSC family protein [Methanobacteriaceae archaeon]|nr:FUSC family protein [Methanobacteriaceae archaeon]MDP2837166.1 FUSC family protein [Methanobacteriaceae archaeon]MDP3034312.1 FUSC family protein [Methanobacteriaceae archaeon]MDP3486181.1 FUSC family protein [Methanobacteriaceae archaeon]
MNFLAQKKGFSDKFKLLSRPTGAPQWKQAFNAIILMIISVMLAKLLGWDNAVNSIAFITLLFTLILDLSIPLRKIAILGLIGFLMVLLAFTTSSVAISSVPVFILFTALWAFFSIPTYIFGGEVGAFGFILFDAYFLSVILVNSSASTLDWLSYCILSFLVASILLIPKIMRREKELNKMIAAGFSPETSLSKILSIRRLLAGIPLDKKSYELFEIGMYLTAFRSYSDVLSSRLSENYLEEFKDILSTINNLSKDINLRIIDGNKELTKKTNKNDISLSLLDDKISAGEDLSNKFSSFKGFSKMSNSWFEKAKVDTLLENIRNVRSILDKAINLISKDSEDIPHEKIKIESSSNSLIEVLKSNFNLQNIYMRHAVRFSLAMTLALLFVHLTHNRDVIWVAMGVLIVIKPDITSTINNLIQRLSFNFLAIIVAIFLGFLFPHQILIILALIMLFFFRAFFPNFMGLSVMALTVFIILIWPTGTVFENATARMIDIFIGSIIALLCVYIILPSRVSFNVPLQIVATINATKKLSKQVMVGSVENYNPSKISPLFRNYMLEENNSDAILKKMNDTFNDVSEDLMCYGDILAANHKLTLDILAIASLIKIKSETNNLELDLSKLNLIYYGKIIDASLESTISVIKKQDVVKYEFNSYEFPDNDIRDEIIPDNIKQYLKWIKSDIDLIYLNVEKADANGLFNEYLDLS